MSKRYLDLIRTHLGAGNIQSALEIIRTYDPLPTDADSCHLIAATLLHANAEQDAISHLERGLADDPMHVPSLRMLGHLWVRRRNSGAAIECFRRLLSATTQHDTADLVALGTATSDLGDHRAAIEILKAARERAPHEYEVLANLGSAYIAASEWDPAIQVLSEAVARAPHGAHARCMLGVALHHSGRSSSALEHLREACRLEPGWATAHFNLGLLLQTLGDVAGARLSLKEAQRLAPDDQDVRHTLELLPQSEQSSPGGITGDLDAFHLPELLEFLRMQRSTGTVAVAARRGAGMLRLFEGELMGASAPGTPRLGEILVREGAIDARTLDSIVEQQRISERLREEPELLGDILIKKRLVSADVLRTAVMEQLIAALSEMMNWTSGQFAFHARPITTRPALSFDTQTLMLEAARRSDEAANSRTGLGP